MKIWNFPNLHSLNHWIWNTNISIDQNNIHLQTQLYIYINVYAIRPNKKTKKMKVVLFVAMNDGIIEMNRQTSNTVESNVKWQQKPDNQSKEAELYTWRMRIVEVEWFRKQKAFRPSRFTVFLFFVKSFYSTQTCIKLLSIFPVL